MAEDRDEELEGEPEDDLEDAADDEAADADDTESDAAVEQDDAPAATESGAALPGDAELGASEEAPGQPSAPPERQPTAIEQLAAQIGLPLDEVQRRLLGGTSVPREPAHSPAPVVDPAEDDDEPMSKGEMRRLIAAERQTIRREAVAEAEGRVRATTTSADIERMVDAELDRYSQTQRLIGGKANAAREDLKKLVYDELGTTPGWGSDATGNIKRAAQKKIRAQMAAAGRLPEAKKPRRDSGEAQAPKAVGAVGKTKGESDEDDNLLSRQASAKNVGLIERLLQKAKRAG
jgi:hypothetical protein